MIKRNLTGESFGSLIVLKLDSYNNKGRSLWRVRCNCGKKYTVTYSGAVYGKSCRECGGLQRRTKNVICARVWNNIQCGAKERNIKIAPNLTREFLWDLYLSQKKKCALSGMDIALAESDASIKRQDISASLDRINSDGDYSQNNVQWVHKKINMMKSNIEQNRFFELCKLVAENI